MEINNIIKDNKPTVFIIIGAPASGKTTYSKQLYNDIITKYDKDIIKLISVDEDIRFKLLNTEKTGIDFDITIEPKVWQILEEMIINYVKDKKNIIVDNTNMSKKRRNIVLQHIPKNVYNIVFIYLKCNINLLLYRNKNRKRIVPNNVIYRKLANFEFPKIDEYDDLIVKYMIPTQYEFEQIINELKISLNQL